MSLLFSSNEIAAFVLHQRTFAMKRSVAKNARRSVQIAKDSIGSFWRRYPEKGDSANAPRSVAHCAARQPQARQGELFLAKPPGAASARLVGAGRLIE